MFHVIHVPTPSLDERLLSNRPHPLLQVRTDPAAEHGGVPDRSREAGENEAQPMDNAELLCCVFLALVGGAVCCSKAGLFTGSTLTGVTNGNLTTAVGTVMAGGELQIAAVILVVFMAVFVITWDRVFSPFAKALRAIRDYLCGLLNIGWDAVKLFGWAMTSTLLEVLYGTRDNVEQSFV